MRGHAVALGLLSLVGAVAWLWIGRPSSLEDSDPVGALLRDPALPERWVDIAEWLSSGRPNLTEQNESKASPTPADREQASYSTARAVALGPAFPPTLYRAATYYQSTGQRDRAISALQRILNLVSGYDTLVFAVFDELHVTASEAVPPEPRPAQSYLRYLMGKVRLADSSSLWKWITARNLADDRLAADFATFLLSQRQYESAVQTWTSYLGARRGFYRRSNFLFNSRFESQPLPSPFDWRIEPLEAAEIAFSSEGLEIRFHGTENLDFRHVSQLTFLPAGRWRLQAEVRSDNITTDEGVRVAAGTALSEPLTGSSDWHKLEVGFTVLAPGNLIDVRFVRHPSLKLENKISGVVFIRSVTLEPSR